ncbi:MAG: FtsX-like permease family protein [Chlorobi bacterium]|nr:FtsX-like permease family protein [Chlorobiota bacterium]
MLKSYLKTAIRLLIRQKEYSLINILGLSIGITAAILILLYVNNELSYDKFHENASQLYRVNFKGEVSGENMRIATSMAPLAIAAKQKIPEIKKQVRLKQGIKNILLSFKHKKFYETGIVFADTGFFNVFSFKLLQGNPQNALSEPYSMVLSKSIAKKYFGDKNPIGNIIIWNNEDEYTITGIVEDAPSNSHISYTVLVSFSTLYDKDDFYINNWGTLGSYTYFELTPNADTSLINEQLFELIKKYFGEELEHYKISLTPFLQPVVRIHLYSNLMAEFKSNGDILNVYVFSVIAILILIIAGINFMNMSTARAQIRTIEIGIRKTLGAQRHMLIFQFITEAILASIISLIFAIFLTELVLPIFNSLTGIEFGINYLEDWAFLSGFIIIAIVVGLFSGSYPAFYLSRFSPINALKNRRIPVSQKGFLRYVLVLSQFVISIILIISVLTIYKQLEFVQNKKLGFNKDNLLTIPLRSKELQNKVQIIKLKIEKIPEVISVTSSDFIIGSNAEGSGYFPEETNEADIFINNKVDYNYINTMKMEIIKGRNFSKDSLSDSTAVLINQSAAEKLDWKNPIGKFIKKPMPFDSLKKFKVIGVVKDFHIESLHYKIMKTILHLNSNKANYITIRLHPDNVNKALKEIKNAWNKIDPTRPFDSFFIDQSFEFQYLSDKRFERLIIYFTILAIFIASLGLFGLSSFITAKRAKEMGIRKVMGSSVNNIVFLLIKDYAKWILLANIIAWPIAYFLMHRWLLNFEYRITIPLVVFILASIISLVIGMFAIGYQAIKTSLTNPVKSLRYE